MSQYRYTQDDLTSLKAQHTSFVGIDSDGCVFPTMEIKQKKCFHGLIVSHWHMEPIEKYVREAAEFVNLYSKWRGENRFPALLRSLDLLRERPDVIRSGVPVPTLSAARKWVESGASLGNPDLEKLAQQTGDPELASLLKWSQDVNADIEKKVKAIAPYPWVRESLEKISRNSDAICVSQTPGEALVREWAEHDITRFVSLIAGQELGKKSEHLALATKGKYDPSKILMIGDAPGDRKAAEAVQALFFPICPSKEEASWERFYKEGYDRFLKGQYAGDYQAKLVKEFEAVLPATPPWKKS